ncbi:hypothetical protein GALL_506060 [mine drainage metagenome]|uniref:Uncharacterized protein n=1 Tax=mine drainage metagenome TaxID=410659 RepID=A0A1J5PW39_9ZZZZ
MVIAALRVGFVRRAGFATHIIALHIAKRGGAVRHHVAQHNAQFFRGRLGNDARPHHRMLYLQKGRLHQSAAIEHRGIGRRQMQRANRDAMAIGNCHRRKIRPVRRNLRPHARRLDQFHGRGIQQPQRLQKRLLLHATDQRCNPRRADVGAFLDDIRHRKLRAIIVEVVDLELAPDQRPLGVDHRLRRDQAKIQRLPNVKDLEGRAQLVQPLHRTVEQRAVRRIALHQRRRAVVGVKIGQRGHGDNLAGVGIHQDTRRALGVHHLHAGVQHFAHCRLHRQVNRQLQWLARVRRITQRVVKAFFDPRHADQLCRIDAFAAKSRAAKDMRRQMPVRIQPHIARPEQQPRIADIMHGLHLLG